MSDYDLYASLGLHRTLGCPDLSRQIDTLIRTDSLSGGHRAQELQMARAVLGDDSRRTLYDRHLDDPAAPEITYSAVRELAVLTPKTPEPTQTTAPSSPTTTRTASPDKGWSANGPHPVSADSATAVSPGRRLGAAAIDAVIMVIITAGLYMSTGFGKNRYFDRVAHYDDYYNGYYSNHSSPLDRLHILVSWTTGTGSDSVFPALISLVVAAVLLVYYVGCEWKWGQTLGKRILGCRVVTVDGTSSDLESAMKRNWWPIIPFFIPPFGVLAWIGVIITVIITMFTAKDRRTFLDRWVESHIIMTQKTDSSK